MRRRIPHLALAICALLTTRCFEIEQTIDIKKDMSGVAGFKLGIDFEPMVAIMANMQHQMSGKTGMATKAEIDAAKADFKKQRWEKKNEDDPNKMKEDITKSLPEGITLLDSNVIEKDFGVTSMFHFGFDRLNHLVGVKLPSKKGEDPANQSVIDQPFQSLELVEKGDTFTIRTKPTNPAESVKEKTSEEGGPKMDPEMEKMMTDAFKKMRIVYRISAPFTVVSSNAMRKEGNTLVWEYDMEKLEKLGKDPKAFDGVTVTYRR